MRCLLHAVVLAALVALGCSGTPEAPPLRAPAAPPSVTAAATATEAAAVAGIVKLPDGKIAPGALVALIPHFELEYAGDPPDVPLTVTDALGAYRFEKVPPGRYGVTATLAGVAAAYGGVHDVTPAAPARVDLAFGGDPILVQGKVRGSTGDAVPNALVQAARMTENEGDVYVTRADAEGRYVLSLPAGPDYFLVAEAPPRPRAYRQISAAAQTADFQLEPAPAPRPSDAEVAGALAARAVPLSTLEIEHGTKDLEALRAMIGDARIVAVGEATHGAREMFLVRHRLLELFAEMGFTVLAVEAGWSDAFGADAYVTANKGTAKAALADLYYWAVNTAEMTSVLDWMRAYNNDGKHKKKLHLRGVDIEFASHAVAAVLEYLAKVDPERVSAETALLMPLRDASAEQSYAGLDKAVLDRTAKGLADLLARFSSERARWIGKSSEKAYVLARRHLELIQKTEALYRTPDGRTGRDAAMAENVSWILGHEPAGTKLVLWAHNSHISAQALGGSDMGERLRATWGKDYFAIGVTFGSGAFHALDWSHGDAQRPSGIGTIELGAPSARSLESALGLAKAPAFALDVRAVDGPFGAWLASRIPMRHIGGIFRGEEAAGVRCAPQKSFDALVYVDKVTASHLLPGAR